MRRHLLTGLGLAVNGLIGTVFSAEVFGAASAILAAASAWAYRQELRQAWHWVWPSSFHLPASDRRKFRQDPGRGDLAAHIVEGASDFRRAESAFNDCRHDANPRRLDLLHAAMVERLRKEGRTPETWRFVEGEKDQFMRVNMADRMTGDAAEEERDKQYLWMVMECGDTWESDE